MNAQELLAEYLKAEGSSASGYMELLADAIRRTIRQSLSKREVGDLEDFEEDCLIAIWTRIESMKQDITQDGIDNLEAFVRRTVHNRYCDAIRRKRPSWYNLKLELLDTFSGKLNVDGFAIWQSPNSSARLCGFEAWQGRTDSAAGACRDLSDSPSRFLCRGIGNQNPTELSVPELAAAVLDWVGGPVEIDDLTSCLAGLLRLRDSEPLSIDAQLDADDEGGSPVDWLLAADVDVEEQVVGQGWLQQVLGWFWGEFVELSIKQRKAIFYGFSVEQAISIVTTCGIDEVSEALELDQSGLTKLLRKLPLPDAHIADELGIASRSVPSVRFKAWRRIQRRARKSNLMTLEPELAEAD